MKTTIDAAGRLVIPKEIRKRAGLEPGTPIDVRWCEGRIEIEPVPLSVRKVRKGHLWVAVPEEDVGFLTGEIVEQTREALKDERSSGSP